MAKWKPNGISSASRGTTTQHIKWPIQLQVKLDKQLNQLCLLVGFSLRVERGLKVYGHMRCYL